MLDYQHFAQCLMMVSAAIISRAYLDRVQCNVVCLAVSRVCIGSVLFCVVSFFMSFLCLVGLMPWLSGLAGGLA